MKPNKVNIIGKIYKIKYVKNASDVDINKRESLWGQIDYWTRTIRIYDNDTNSEDIFETLMHEIFHGIVTELNLSCFQGDSGHDELSTFSVVLTDTLIRNNFIKLEKG